MIPDNLLAQVDTERLYRHALHLEGERHPIRSSQALDAAADYVLRELRTMDLAVRVHQFQVAGFPATFRNIEARLGDPHAPAAVLMNHYDTFYGTAGANDNAAAVAVTLEAARVLATLPEPPPICLLFFTLEEGNPAFQARLWADAQARGLMDGRWRYTSYQASRLIDSHRYRSGARYQNGMSLSAVLASVTDEMRAELPENIYQHLRLHEEVYAGVDFLPGNFGHLGSWAWMDDAATQGIPLRFGICLDEIGRTVRHEGAQELLPGLSWDMLQTYRVDRERAVGDWEMIITDRATGAYGGAFCAHCRRTDIDLSYGYWHVPLTYEMIKQHMPQAFGSDYSAFWHAGVPAMFVFDTAGWRKPYYGHTMADTVDRLDFDQITRIARASIATLVDPMPAEVS